MTFSFQFKRIGSLLWRRRRVVGYKSILEQDRMLLYFPNGSIEEIAAWSKCHARLGADWVIAMQKKMEKEAGTAIPVNVS